MARREYFMDDVQQQVDDVRQQAKMEDLRVSKQKQIEESERQQKEESILTKVVLLKDEFIQMGVVGCLNGLMAKKPRIFFDDVGTLPIKNSFFRRDANIYDRDNYRKNFIAEDLQFNQWGVFLRVGFTRIIGMHDTWSEDREVEVFIGVKRDDYDSGSTSPYTVGLYKKYFDKDINGYRLGEDNYECTPCHKFGNLMGEEKVSTRDDVYNSLTRFTATFVYNMELINEGKPVGENNSGFRSFPNQQI
jgi:hypothetical protein